MALKKTVKFSKNWNNKLNNQVFTTIRKPGFWVNDSDYCVIVLDDKVFCYAQCVDKYEIKAIDLNPTLLRLDTGLNIFHATEVFSKFGINLNDKEQMITILTFSRMPNASPLKAAINSAIKLDL